MTPRPYSEADKFEIYAWYRGNSEIWIDNFQVETFVKKRSMRHDESPYTLSIIVPAYNEEKPFAPSWKKLTEDVDWRREKRDRGGQRLFHATRPGKPSRRTNPNTDQHISLFNQPVNMGKAPRYMQETSEAGYR